MQNCKIIILGGAVAIQNCKIFILGGAVAHFDHRIFNFFRGGGGSMDDVQKRGTGRV